MIDFLKQQQDIIDYITDNYQEYLNNYSIEKPQVVSDFLDFDRFKNSFTCFVDFDNSTFPNGGYNDDCSKTENLVVNIFLAFRNDTPSNLNNKMLNATTAFYNMIRNNEMNTITANINRIEFFKYVEGTNNIFASKLTLELNKEI